MIFRRNPCKRNGYIQIEFKVNGIRKHTSVHILFARTFIPNQSQVTPKENAECRVFPNPSRGRENVQHAVRLGLCSNNPIKRAVKQIFDDGSIQEFPFIAEAQRVTGIDKVNIGRVYRGIRNHAGGFR
ncbi:2612_t:CDS:2 [Rhizophagus irregularis]|nr:2612_t:CDS:2 [Rhizophagus irregularis]